MSSWGPSPAPRLARWSIWLPVSVMMFGGYARLAGAKPLLALIGFAAILASLGGFACAIAALCHRRDDESNVVGRSVAGLVVNSCLLALFFTAFVGGFKKGYTQSVKARESLASVKQSIEEARQDVRRSFDTTNGIKANPEVFDKTVDALKKASQQMEGESGRVMEASAAYLTELQQLSKLYDAEFKRLEEAHILDAGTLTNKAQIGERKEIVQQFLKVNGDIDRFVVAGEQNFRSEMTRRKVSQTRIEREVEAFRKSSQSRTPLIRAIRASDKRIGNGMLNVLTLLESDWGNWKYDRKSGGVVFSDQAILDQYLASLDDIVASGKQQVALQQRLISMQ